ncbi:MAG: lamin tail domain-containing protein, partial [Pyrinomonadaceae bacterium]
MNFNHTLIKSFGRQFLTAVVVAAFFAAVLILPTGFRAKAQTESKSLAEQVSAIFQSRNLNSFLADGSFFQLQINDKKTRKNSLISSTLVISQVYGGGGNSGATYKNDFIEIFNLSNTTVNLTGYSVQYFSSSGSAGGSTPLTGMLQPGQYYLIQEAQGSGGTADLPMPDATGTIALSGTNGRVDLLDGTSTLVDRVAYGTATPAEGTATPALTNPTSARRLANGCTDTDNNSADFAIITAFQTGNPRNTSSPLTPCGGGGGVSLSVNDVSLAEGNTGTTAFVFTITLSQPAPAGGVSFTAATADGTATVADNDYQLLSPTVFTIPAGSSSTTVTVQVVGDTTTEPNETFSLNISNPTTGVTIADGQGVGTINNDDVVLIPVNQVQGGGATSPQVGLTVTTSGVVTAIRNSGFYIQTPDANADSDPNTSEGVFVFTGSAPPAAVVLGNLVQVTGAVQEFIPSADPNQRPLTEIIMPTVSVLSTGNPLPVPTVLTAADTNPAGGPDVLEKYEGMRVQVNSLRAVSPTGGNVSEPNATATTNGTFYGVISGVNRPFREPGIDVLDPLPAGAPANIPRFDGNPERIRVFSFGQTGATAIDVTTDAIVSNLVGVLDYGFRTYTIFPDPATPPTVTGNISAIPVPDSAASEMTVANFNLERFFDTVNDPNIGEPVLTMTAFDNRLNKASLAIRNVLKTPDVLGVEEVENLTTLQTLANKINSDAVNAGQPNPNYQAYLEEGNDVGGIDVGFLIKTPKITAIAVTQYGKDTTYTNPVNNQQELLNDRPPLRLQGSAQLTNGTSYQFSVIVNHLRSLIGLEDADGRVRAKRRAQAEYLASLVQEFQQTEPVFVVGDFNAYQVNDGYVDVIGTIKGTPAPSDQVVLASSDLVNPDLIDLADTLPSPILVATNQAYSYSFDGNAQILDHILVTQSAFSRVTSFHYARVDADFPEIYRNDPNRPERISDHDAPVAYVSLAAATANITGRITTAAGRPVNNI